LHANRIGLRRYPYLVSVEELLAGIAEVTYGVKTGYSRAVDVPVKALASRKRERLLALLSLFPCVRACHATCT
jgi:hypothetical protein